MNHKLIQFTLLALFSLLATISASAEWKEKVLYSFQGGNDGAVPVGSLVRDVAGNIYGATEQGGGNTCRSPEQCGTVFQLTPPAQQGDPWTENVLHVFQGNANNDGATPSGGLVMDNSGNLYGAAGYGGTGNCVLLGDPVGCGAVYELSPPKQKGGSWTETIIYSFPTSKQGYVPTGDLVFDSVGNLYGATTYGGGKGTTCNGYYQYCGAIFELSPPKKKGGRWTEKVLHGFAGRKDGASPNGGLVLDSAGNIYGTTYGGGEEGGACGVVGCGTIFQLTPPVKKRGAWTEKRIHVFATSEANPSAGLMFEGEATFYGTTTGTVFQIEKPPSKPWSETTLYTFGQEAFGPQDALVLDKSGSLCGTTYSSNVFHGTVFCLKPPIRKGHSWNFDLLYGFAGAPDGGQPAASLLPGKYSAYYSSTQKGGTGNCSFYGCGVIFEVQP